MSPLLCLCLFLKSPVNSTNPSTSTLRLFALNGPEGTEMDSSRLYRFHDEFSQMQANGRFALEFLRRDARLTGFWGCNQDIDVVNQIKASHYNRRSYTNSTGKGAAIGKTDDNTLTTWTQQITTLNESDTITLPSTVCATAHSYPPASHVD